MNELELPELFKGGWDHVLILTYGADIPFFENALWRQFGARCRNKVILADGQRYLEACENYAQGGLVRHLNQQYVTEGIFTEYAAHAKLILLTSPDQGRLLVGSGNLGWQGYASGGELFTQYEYGTKDTVQPEALNAFLAVREFVQALFDRGYISGSSARKRINHLFEQTPWLFQKPLGDWQPVRHNLEASFLDQLQAIIAGEPIQELTILSPFYDKEAIALARLLDMFKPQRATLLIQPKRTSADPQALQAVLDRFPNCQVRPFEPDDESSYVHAKLYLFKLPKRTLCLQGSPNLSQVAMLRPAAQGNIEVANLLSSPANAFDDLLDKLNIQPAATRLEDLDLTYFTPGPSARRKPDEWQLTGGEWYEEWLFITYRGKLPRLQTASLRLLQRVFPLQIHYQDHGRLEIKLPPEIIDWLSQPVPVSIEWREGDKIQTSNPVFICNRASLNQVLEVSGEDGSGTLARIGNLDLEDEEIEALLDELQQVLVIDRQSVWQMAGRALPSSSGNDDEALHLRYADINYDLLRQHPKIIQYQRKGSGSSQYVQSRLQIILNAITDHFQGLLDVSEQAKVVKSVIDTGAETEEEGEHEAEEKERQQRSAVQRLQRILKNFIGRYLRGLQSPDFQEFAGFEVIAQNYVIFSHLLWSLFARGWVDSEFIVDALRQTWVFFWGSSTQLGYYQALSLDQQVQVQKWLQKHHTGANFLAALAYSADLIDSESWHKLQFSLRDFWRDLLCQPPFEITAKTLEETWRVMASLIPYESLPPSRIVDRLARLAEFETEYSFKRQLEKSYGYPVHSCDFKDVKVWRADLDTEVDVKCLVFHVEDALADKTTAIEVLQNWIRFKSLDYYRIACPNANQPRRMLFYEVATSSGAYLARDQGDVPEYIGSVVVEPLDWEVSLQELSALAQQVEAGLTLLPVKASVVS